MAMNKGVNIQIGAALSSSLGSAVSGAKKQLGQLGSVMSTIGNQKSGVDQLMLMKDRANELGKAYGIASLRLRDLKKSYTQDGRSPNRDEVREIERLDRQTIKAKQSLDLQRNALRELRNELQLTGVNTKALGSESTRLGSQMELLRTRTLALQKAQGAQQANRAARGQMVGDVMSTAMLGMALAAPAKIAIAFDDQMRRVGAVSNARGAQLEALTAKARELGRDTKFTAIEVGQGMEYLAMAGFNAEQQLGAIGGVLNVAAASGVELGRASDIVSNALTGFGLAANQAGRVGDVLTKTFTSSNTTLESLGETLKYVAPVARAAGMNLELAAAIAGVMGDAGIQGSMAGTSMRSVILRMIAPAKDGQKHLGRMGFSQEQLTEALADPEGQAAAQHVKKMGIDIADKDGNMRAWEDILTELATKMGNMTEQDRLAAASAIFGKNAVSGGLAMLSALNKDANYNEEIIKAAIAEGKSEEEVQKIRENLEKNKTNKLLERYKANQRASEEGFAKKVAEFMESGPGGALRSMRSAVEDLGIEIGNVLAPAIKVGAEYIRLFANKSVELIKEFPFLSRVVFVGVGGFLALKTAVLGLGLAMTVLKAPYLAAQGYLAATRAGMALVSLQTATTAGSTTMLGGVWATFSGFLAATPIGWVVAGIAALAAAGLLIYKYWEPIGAFFSGLWEGMIEPLGGVLDALGPVGEAFRWVGEMVSGLFGWLKELIQPVSFAKEELQGFSETGKTVGMVIGSVLAGSIEAVTLPLRAVIAGIKWLKGIGSGQAPSFESGMGSGMAMPTSPMTVQPVNKGGTTTHNNTPQINITVPPGTDAQGVAEAARREVARAMSEAYLDDSGMLYD